MSARRCFGASIVAIAMAAVPSAAYAQQTYSFDIPAQKLDDSLRAIGAHSRTSIGFDPALTKGKKAAAVRGAMSVSNALETALAHSGLEARPSGSGYIVAASTGDLGNAVADASSVGANSHASAGQDVVSQDLAEANQEIVVTGTNIRGAQNPTIPIVQLRKKDIDASGYSTTAGLMQSLPQNFSLNSQSTVTIPGATFDGSQGAAINLRAVGEGTTLTLLNGHRLAPGFFGSAVDVSAIPLSAVERVDVLLDSASAIYGSDAVGGVVNFVLRRDYKGFETRARVGFAPNGVEEYRLGQAAGTAWSTGGILIAGEYYSRDLLPASKRDFVPDDSLVGSLLPREKNASLIVSGHQEVSPDFEVSGDLLYSHRKSFNRGGIQFSPDSFHAKNPQIVANISADWKFSPSWRASLQASHASNDMTVNEDATFYQLTSKTKYKVNGIQAKLDGELVSLAAGPVRVAAGADYRTETFRSRQVSEGLGSPPYSFDKRQNVTSLFGELLIPIFSPDQNVSGMRRLTLSAAGRYDHYSSFGSSFDPHIGLSWDPVDRVRFRGSYGTAYKAPNLPDYDVGADNAFSSFVADPASGTGTSYVLSLLGNDSETYKAQRSKSWTLGAEVLPLPDRSLRLGAGFYHIRYKNRLSVPTFSTSLALSDPEAFAGLITRDPSLALVNGAIDLATSGLGFYPYDENFNIIPNFDPSSIEVLVDLRKRNLASVITSGVDLTANYTATLGETSLTLATTATHIFKLDTRTTPTSIEDDRVGTLNNAPKWRIRSSVSVDHGPWNANLFFNYTSAFKDPRVSPPDHISSYKTVDLNVAHRSRRFDIALSVQNLFNEDPPAVLVLSPGFETGFDPTNANPLGRLVALEATLKL